MRFVCFCFFHAGVPKVRDDMEVTAAEDKASTDLVLQSTEVIHVPYLITSGANTIKHFFFFFHCTIMTLKQPSNIELY